MYTYVLICLSPLSSFRKIPSLAAGPYYPKYMYVCNSNSYNYVLGSFITRYGYKNTPWIKNVGMGTKMAIGVAVREDGRSP